MMRRLIGAQKDDLDDRPPIESPAYGTYTDVNNGKKKGREMEIALTYRIRVTTSEEGSAYASGDFSGASVARHWPPPHGV